MWTKRLFHFLCYGKKLLIIRCERLNLDSRTDFAQQNNNISILIPSGDRTVKRFWITLLHILFQLAWLILILNYSGLWSEIYNYCNGFRHFCIFNFILHLQAVLLCRFHGVAGKQCNYDNNDYAICPYSKRVEKENRCCGTFIVNPPSQMRSYNVFTNCNFVVCLTKLLTHSEWFKCSCFWLMLWVKHYGFLLHISKVPLRLICICLWEKHCIIMFFQTSRD